MTRAVVLLAVLASLAWEPTPARAEEDPDPQRIEELERRVEELEERARDREARQEEKGAEPEDPGEEATPGYATLADWTRRVRLGGSADVGYFYGETDSVLHDVGFAVWDARFFVDAELGGDVRLGDAVLLRNAGLSFEWNLVRLGDLANDVGDLFAELQGIGGSSWANLQVGRFQIPVGEAYLRYGKGQADRPFVTHAVGGPWFWDEGVKLYGSARSGRFGYLASVTDGDTAFTLDSDSDKQVTLKLFVDPRPWLHLSLSGLRSGRLGAAGTPAMGALWLGESWARAFGSGSAVPSFVDGRAVPDGPDVLRDTWLLAGDVVLRRPQWGHLWLAYGAYWIDSQGDAGRVDTTLHYWIAELVLEGALASPMLSPFYVGLRASGLGTYDRDLGYLLDVRYSGTLGYNMESLEAYQVVLGWRLTRWLRVRAEYSHVEIDLVRGVPSSIRSASNDTDQAAIEIGVHF